MTYSKLPAITRANPPNHVPEILQQHFMNTSTITDAGHMSNYIRHNKVKMVDDPLKVE